MTIETRHYVASEADIEKLAGQAIDGELKAGSARGAYFKALIATTQHKLGSQPRLRNVQAPKLSPEDTKTHLAAFDETAKRFHEAVVRVAKQTVPEPDGPSLRSRTSFAASAASTIRGYIRASNDIRAIAAHKAVKSALATPRTRRKFTVEMMKRRANVLGTELEKIARNLLAANEQVARDTLQPLLAKFAIAAGATAHTTRDPEEAANDGRPWQTKTGVFVPMKVSEGRRLAS